MLNAKSKKFEENLFASTKRTEIIKVNIINPYRMINFTKPDSIFSAAFISKLTSFLLSLMPVRNSKKLRLLNSLYPVKIPIIVDSEAPSKEYI
jgi:hypothetical protein